MRRSDGSKNSDVKGTALELAQESSALSHLHHKNNYYNLNNNPTHPPPPPPTPPVTMDPDHTSGIAAPILRPDHPPRRRCFPSFTSSFAIKTSIWAELGGAVGDLGTYIPIVLAVSLVNGLDLSTTLIFTALYNAATGFLFAVPMPVQPMKSIAAVAISESTHLTIPQIMAAGLCTAGVLFILGATGLMSLAYRLIPLPVVRGVQLSQGLAFAFTAIKYIRYNQNFSSSKTSSSDTRPWLGLDGLILAISALLFIILVTGSGDDEDTIQEQQQDEARCDNTQRRRCIRGSFFRKIPSALLVFLLGLALCFARNPSIIHNIKFGPSKITVVKISWQDWKTGFIRAAIPQIPLSVLNSVIAVCKLSADLFPDRRVTARSVSVSVGLMNMVGCWFGAMPVCHGAGGLAGQYRFGGRSGAAVLFLAIGKMVLGLVFGNSFVRILAEFPIGLLGVLLLFAGIELAMASRDMGSKEDSFVMLMCAAVSLTGSSAALGFGCGIVLYLLLRLRDLDCCSSALLLTGKRQQEANNNDDHIV
ncbi:molybdate transporter 2 [Dioscorea cayenensis subsp. rotundata]|uniref:Molybdate transporter 2 n=1 Tax=Dioscorea cayennensis subsp. rotundata TaxID=55577 RepID=A0AB40ASS1_DIOCR|nr:molybdate transporter 2 [Dioscorea cayenensis subsp. rotundata]